MADETRKPFWIKCGGCCHCWAAAYLPMEASMFGRIAMKAICPMCGNGPKNNLVAKQHDGVLREPSGAGA